MLDLGKLSDAVSSLFGAVAGPAAADGILQHLDNLGIDPTALQGMDAGQLGDLLARNGIDIAGMEPGQIADLAQQLGGGSELAAGLGEWVSQHLPRS